MNDWLTNTQKTTGKGKTTSTGGTASNTLTGSTNNSDWLSNVQVKRPTQTFEQYKPVSIEPIKVVQTETPQPQPNIFQKAVTAIKNVDFKRLGSSLVGGSKTVPGQTIQAGGIILDNLTRQKEAFDNFFSGEAITKKISEAILGKKVTTANDINRKVELQIAQQLRDTGTKKQVDAREAYSKTYTPSTGLQGYLESAAFNIPQMAATTTLAIATTLVTKNPALGTAVGLSTSYGLGASEVYQNAREAGLDDNKAMPLATAGGAIVGALDFVPLERLLRKTGVGKPVIEKVKKTLINKIAMGVVDTGIQSGFEGITEGAQEVVNNAIKATYTENQDLFAGVKESAIVGTLLGGFTNVTVSGAIGALDRTAQPKDVLQNIETNIQDAINMDPQERTPEQTEVVKAVFTQTLTADQAATYVIDNNLTGTDEGKEIMKVVAQAKQTNQEISITPDETESGLDVELVSAESAVQNQQAQQEAENDQWYRGGTGEPGQRGATFYTKNPEIAQEFAQKTGGKVTQEKIQLKNPLVAEDRLTLFEKVFGKEKAQDIVIDGNYSKYPDTKQIYESMKDNFDESLLEEQLIFPELKKQGYDGVILKQGQYDQEELMKFDDVATTTQENVVLLNKNVNIGKNTYKLPEVLRNEELYSKYPQLKEYKVHFGSSTNGELASLVNGSRDIILSKSGYDPVVNQEKITALEKQLSPYLEKEKKQKLSKEEYEKAASLSDEIGLLKLGKDKIGVKLNNDGLRSLIHEIEHAKQDITGATKTENDFLSENAKGTSKEGYFTNPREIQARNAEEKYLKSYEKATKPIKSSSVTTGISRLQERLSEQLLETDGGTKYELDPETGKYNKLNLQKDTESAIDYINKDPEKALKVARGLIDPPAKQTTNAIALAVALKAKEEGNVKLWKDLILTTSLRNTRYGQEIVSLRGHFNNNSPENFIKRVLDSRMATLGKSVVTEAEKAVGKAMSAKTRAVAKIDTEVQKLSARVKADQTKIKLAQDIIDSLRCK